MAQVRLDSVCKHHGQKLALDGLSLTVDDGEFLCLLGPSGAGKTTLLRCIAGLETPDAGDVLFDGISVLDHSPSERDVAMVFDSYALYPHLTVFENIAYPLRERRLANADVDARVRGVAERLGVAHTLDRPPQTLSGGEMQRVAIARAIVRQARVYLLDQPLSNLDAQLREQMRSELKRLHQEIGSTLVYATPDQLEAMTMADRIAVMRGGRVLQCATPEETYFRPRHAFAAEYVGDPPMNLLSAVVSDDGIVRTRWFELEHAGLTDGEWVVGIRPEDLNVGVDEDHVRDGDIVFEASVFAAEMCGDHHVLTLALGEDRLSALWSRGDSLPGHADRAIVGFAPECVHLIDAASERVVTSLSLD